MNKKVVTLGEMLLRLSTNNNNRFITSKSFDIHFGGAEINVGVNLANLGLNSYVITKVPNNDIGTASVNYLKSHGVYTDYVKTGSERLGIYFLEQGTSLRNSKVIYDRADSAFCNIDIDELDIDEILENTDLFHVSGITLTLSEKTFELSKLILQKCKEKNITTSFDFNYRSKLWTLQEAKEKIVEILPYVDIAFAGYLDFINILGFKTDATNLMDTYKDLYPKVAEKYNFKYIVSSMRDVISASKNNYKCILFHNDNIYESKQYQIDIVDRVGSGDAFTSGFLYSFLTSDDNNYRIQFAAASAAIKHTIVGDANLTTKEEIENLFNSDSFEIGR